MKSYLIRYLAGTLFIGMGLYELIENNDLPETSLYGFLGLSFLLMGYLIQHPKHPEIKLLNTISWLLIAGAALSFLYVLTIP